MEKVRERKDCRICGSGKFFEYLDLGKLPLANSYLTAKQIGKPEFSAPLAIRLCLDCGLSQLSHVVNPDIMFRHYLYVSSTPKTFRDHCDALAIKALEFINAKSNKFALDIASNDGCLLRSFRALGFKILGVDPAQNLAREANTNDIPTICDYWSTRLAKEVVKDFGRPSVITATNVFAHVDDLHEFINGILLCLDDKSVLILEFPYILEFIKRNLFDTVYHEHLSYLGLYPISKLMKEYGMEIFQVRLFPKIHGGTIRLIAAKRKRFKASKEVASFIDREKKFGILSKKPYLEFARRVKENKDKLNNLLAAAKKDGRSIWAYGASAKGNTLLNYFGITNEIIEKIIDDNPKKWSLFTPGTCIPICGIDELKKNRQTVNDILLLAWNFAEEIQSRCAAVGYRGDFIYPVSKPKRISP